MSGVTGTIGNAEKDKVVAWIYRHVETLEVKKRNRIFKLIGSIHAERNQLIKISDWQFRQRLAKLVLDDYTKRIEIHYGNSPLSTRLRNLAVRNYRQTLYEDEIVDGMV